MLVKLLEPLNVSDEMIEKLAQPIKELGHEFVYYNNKATEVQELIKRSEGAEVVMIANNPYSAEVINSNDHLKLINVAFTGFDHVGLKESHQQNVLVCNAAGYANQAVAELTIGLVLDVYRRISQGNSDIRSSNYPGPFQGSEINGKKVGIIGTGKIGLMTAKLFKAFGAELIAIDFEPSDEAKELGFSFMPLDELLAEADIVSLHVPLLDSTRGMISKEKIALMKETAVLINCARGPIVDNAALAEALNEGVIAGAGIDVFDTEPALPADYPLLHAKNAVLTPHVAFLTNEAMELRAQIAFDNTLAFLKGQPQNIVNR